MYKLLSRKLLGERYASGIKAMIIFAIMGFGLHQTGVTLPLAQSVLIFTAIIYSGSVIIQTLFSRDNVRCLKGLFAMPHDDRKTLWEYAAAVGLYTLLTKTSMLAALLFAFVQLSPTDIALFLLCFVYALFGGFAAFGFLRRVPVISGLLAAAALALAFFLPVGLPAVIILSAADLAVIALFFTLRLDSFYVQESSRVKAAGHGGGRARMLVLRYIVRYMLANKNYIISTLFIIGFAVFFAIMSEKQGLPAGAGCGIGLAFASLNTPLATIVSANRGLNRKLNALPGKTNRFFVPYAVVLFFFNLLIYALFMTIYTIAGGELSIRAGIAAILFAAEGAAFVSLLEDKFTITKWKAEPDLWRNPRKYILPAVLMLEAALIFMI